MKYDFSKCNNLQFKAKGNEGKVMTGYLKVTKDGEKCVVYVFPTNMEGDKIYDRGLQLVTRDYALCELIEDFSKWADRHDLEIIPRDPESYTDWKVGDRVLNKCAGGLYTIAAKLGDIVFLLSDNDAVESMCTAILAKYYALVLTDYEKELQELEKKKKECPFKEGDKVLVRDSDTSWKFDVFQNYEENALYSYECIGSPYEQCIPLNEHTWKLLGTTDEYETIDNNESL